MFLKVGNKIGGFYDPKTKTVIRRGEIAEVKNGSDLINARIRAKGLIKCTEEEYKEQELRKKINGVPVLAGTQEVPIPVSSISTEQILSTEEIKSDSVEEETKSTEQILSDDSPLKKPGRLKKT